MTNGRTDRQIHPVFYRTLSPSEPLPKKAHLGLSQTLQTLNQLLVGDFYSIKIVRLEFELCGWDLSLEAEIWP